MVACGNYLGETPAFPETTVSGILVMTPVELFKPICWVVAAADTPAAARPLILMALDVSAVDVDPIARCGTVIDELLGSLHPARRLAKAELVLIRCRTRCADEIS